MYSFLFLLRSGIGKFKMSAACMMYSSTRHSVLKLGAELQLVLTCSNLVRKHQ